MSSRGLPSSSTRFARLPAPIALGKELRRVHRCRAQSVSWCESNVNERLPFILQAETGMKEGIRQVRAGRKSNVREDRMGSLGDCTWILGLTEYRVVELEREHNGRLVIAIERRG